MESSSSNPKEVHLQVLDGEFGGATNGRTAFHVLHNAADSFRHRVQKEALAIADEWSKYVEAHRGGDFIALKLYTRTKTDGSLEISWRWRKTSKTNKPGGQGEWEHIKKPTTRDTVDITKLTRHIPQRFWAELGRVETLLGHCRGRLRHAGVVRTCITALSASYLATGNNPVAPLKHFRKARKV